MYSNVNEADVDAMTAPVEGNDAIVVPVGYVLQSEESRPNIWEYEPGMSSSLHRHSDQEEVYYVIEGELALEVGEEPTDLEEHTVEAGDTFVIEPDAWRRLTGVTESRLIVVGAPNVPNDHETYDDS
ncbi:MAG: cupin domain-containing protein [Natrialbaceae archaeon]|nr:cupin domain-containing protein [Natrialbaceae archaeon]